MDGKHLFKNPDQSGCGEQYDLDNLNIITVAYAKKHIDAKYIGIFPDNLKKVLSVTYGKLAVFDNPGPFKKAAALTMGLVEHCPFYYLLSDMDMQPNINEWDWKLSTIVAVKMTQIYLTATMPGWKEIRKESFRPPSLISKHFMSDFRAIILNRPDQIDIRLLALVWELMTYTANIDHPIQGEPETSYEIPGIKVS